MTVKPSLCRRWQIAVPMPPMPPVTYATLFWLIVVLLDMGLVLVLRSHAFDGEGNPHAAADAQRSDALLGLAALHLVQERDEDAAAGRTDGVPDRDRTAVDVDL